MVRFFHTWPAKFQNVQATHLKYHVSTDQCADTTFNSIPFHVKGLTNSHSSMFFVFNPWDLYYQGWKNNNGTIIFVTAAAES